MRVSRIARDTSRVAEAIATGKEPRATRRQTRSALANPASRTSNGILDDAVQGERYTAPHGNDQESISGAKPGGGTELDETLPQQLRASSRKRKRGVSPSIRSAPVPAKRISPRKTLVKKEEEEEEIKFEIENPLPSGSSPARKRRPARKVVGSNGEVQIHPPLHWEDVYDTVKQMRKRLLAPVDTMGCERLAEEKASPEGQRLQTLIALMLSSQTKDTTTFLAMRNLQTQLPGNPPGLTLANLLTVPPATLNDLIFSVGFHNNKTRYIKATAQILQDQFAGDIPDTVEGLMALPGVGPKMAYLCLSAAWGRTEGIGVDVHVHRITNLWGWHKTRTPEETRAMLEAWLPRDKWHEINHLLVGFGQMLCKPAGRECWNCDIGAKGLCPGMVRGVKGKVAKKEMLVVGEAEGKEGMEQIKGLNKIKVEEVKVEEREVTAADIEDAGDGG
ncbi:MAG: DNA N-glycosylase and apurinic/apyrimidinic (AP) lyase [Caeruleum heppii]|nr:MAG: DNA N-glycosylase and apurinic/apyrimidinic (AP) lyase [Caeruleum heppii]